MASVYAAPFVDKTTVVITHATEIDVYDEELDDDVVVPVAHVEVWEDDHIIMNLSKDVARKLRDGLNEVLETIEGEDE